MQIACTNTKMGISKNLNLHSSCVFLTGKTNKVECNLPEKAPKYFSKVFFHVLTVVTILSIQLSFPRFHIITNVYIIMAVSPA